MIYLFFLTFLLLSAVMKGYVLLCAFAKLRKAIISFLMSVRMEQLGSRWTHFHEIWYLSILRKSVEKFKFH